MKIAITEVSDPKEALLALGVKTLLSQMGIGMDMQADFSGTIHQAARAFDSDPEPVPAARLLPAVAPVKRKYTKRAAKAVKAPGPQKKATAKKTAAAPAVEEKPRVTIRQQILDCLKTGAKTVREVTLKLGLGDNVNIAQHLYLIGRDKLAVKDEETGMWSVAA